MLNQLLSLLELYTQATFLRNCLQTVLSKSKVREFGMDEEAWLVELSKVLVGSTEIVNGFWKELASLEEVT